MPKQISKLQQFRDRAAALLSENAPAPEQGCSRWRRFLHFWVLVWRSFVRNRCPVRASALAYATLLALIPMLAVVMSITSTFLKQEGEGRIDQFIEKMVASVIPPANVIMDDNSLAPDEPDENEKSSLAEDERVVAARKSIARKINQFIQNTRSGALGVTGSVLLIFAGISMLTRIETTFNDIWGVPHGRTWFMRIVLYWGVLSLAPILVVVAVGLASGPHFESTKRLLATTPFIGNFLIHFGFQVLPVVLLCLTFAAFYKLMPNAKVHWDAALVGGLVGGLLFHLNNVINVLYVSRVVSNSKIYGSLGLVPVFMIGLYFSWLILLFGGQVAYAFQNRSAYLEERQVENINQRGREFVALRLLTLIGVRYLNGAPSPTIAEMSAELCVPSRLVRQITQTLTAARLMAELSGPETAYLPARPMERITCHDILLAMRASQGEELATKDEPTRSEVFGEFQKIQEAERHAASSVTMLDLAQRAQHQQLKELSA